MFVMFSDIVVAFSFQLNKTKCSHYVNYGLSPFIKDFVAKDVRSPYFSVLFNFFHANVSLIAENIGIKRVDENLNKVLQHSQMDIQ